jgi:RND family efflux transporter MFP subunit
MTGPASDLSRLRIDRDQPSPGLSRAFKRTLVLAVSAVVLVGGAVFALRRGAGIRVQVARAEVIGGSGGSTGITANGYVVARTKAAVSSKIPGRLEFLGVTEGSIVRRGEIIGRLEHADYAAQAAQAEADLVGARASLVEEQALREQLGRDLVRAQDLATRNLGPTRDVETLESQVTEADAHLAFLGAQVQRSEAAVQVARATVENTNIRAPFDGTVLVKDAEVGEVVAPSVGGGLTRGAVVTMADLKTLEVEVDVNEAYIAQIRNGQPARIVLDAYPDRNYAGRVRQIIPTADRQKATVQVKVSILKNDGRILPEMAARVEFLTDSTAAEAAPATSHVFVPSAAVRDEGGQAVVWTVRDGRLRRSVVDAGPVSADRREIRSGLSGGEQVVTGQSAHLVEGQPVTIVPSVTTR